MTTPTGRFVWFDHVARDEGKAKAFFGELFGWKTQTVPLPASKTTYTMFAAGDQMLGGFTPKAEGPATWLSYLQVADVRATCDKITSLGGKLLKPPEKVSDFGTQAIVADPLGGTFALWQPAKAEGSGDYQGKPNTWVWNELYTADPAKSLAFYSAIGGFAEDKMEMPQGTYHILTSDGKGRAGVMKPPQPMPQAWMPYVHVTDVDRTVAKAKQLGATIHLAAEDIPGVGRIAILADPQGARLGVLTPAPAAT